MINIINESFEKHNKETLKESSSDIKKEIIRTIHNNFDEFDGGKVIIADVNDDFLVFYIDGIKFVIRDPDFLDQEPGGLSYQIFNAIQDYLDDQDEIDESIKRNRKRSLINSLKESRVKDFNKQEILNKLDHFVGQITVKSEDSSKLRNILDSKRIGYVITDYYPDYDRETFKLYYPKY